ncbi:MAG: potassium/proton antiporter [Saprospiraceae bacterium]|nr:potassium/proton antiporter [Saprospiraceae bacterium]
MLPTLPYILLAAGILIIVNLVAGRFATRFGAPTLLATLAIGVIFGNGGPYDFDYNFPVVTLRFSEIALCVIIFSGGFESNWKRFRPIFWQGVSLATLGVLLTVVATAVFAYGLLGWSWTHSLLLGAVVSATDAAAVFSILENNNLSLKPGVREVLELESGANDPMAFFLTLSVSAMLISQPSDAGLLALSGNFLWTMLVGAATGLLAGKFIHLLARHVPLKRGQFPIVLLAWILILYAVNSLLGGSAFLSVYLAGMILGNSPWVQRDFNIHFFESFSWLMETALFLVLGLQVYLFELQDVLWEGLILSAVLIFISRPFGVLGSLFFFKKIGWRFKVFYSWVGLRGATPIVFALIPIVSQVPEAYKIFNIAFIVVVVSMLVQGTTVSGMAKVAGVEQT